MKNILNISLKTRCFPHVSFGGNLLGAFLPRLGSGITSQAWPGGSTRSAPVPPDIPNLSVLSHGDAPHHWPGHPTGSSTSTSLSRTGQDDNATRCPRHPTFPLPVTGSAPINHSGRPGLHMNYALGVILILQIDFSQTFLRKHTHGNSHPI